MLWFFGPSYPHLRRAFPAILVVPCVTFSIGLSPALQAQQPLIPAAQSALTSMLGGKSLTKLTLTGSATWIAGSLKETGTVSLAAGPDGSVSETWTLPTQSHGISETGFAAGKSCSYTDKRGNQHESTSVNCVQPVTWFAPWVALSLLANGDLITATDATQSGDTAAGVARLHFQTKMGGIGSTQVQARLSNIANRTAVSVLVDQKTSLPSSLAYDYVLDSDTSRVIAYSVVFSDYRSEQGFMIPHRIQRYVQRVLQADITITSVSAS